MNVINLIRSGDLSLFDQFWSAYPHKRGKGDARKAWKQVDGDKHFTAIMGSIDAYKAHVTNTSWLNYKFPAGWLRDERWHDEYEDEQVQSKAAGFLQRRADMKRLS